MNRDELAHELWAAAHLAPGEGISDAVARMISLLAAQPAEAEGVEVVAWLLEGGRLYKPSVETTEERADRRIAERKDETVKSPLVRLTALSAVTAERDRLREDRDSQQRVCIAEMEKADQLRAEVEGLRKDADRYRWLRGRLPGSAYRIAGVIYSEGGDGVDAAIDAAMSDQALKVIASTATKLYIDDAANLDPITVFLEDYEPGKGKITVNCWGKSWTAYWGGMSGDDVATFFCRVDTHYIIGYFAPQLHSTRFSGAALVENARRAVIDCRRGRTAAHYLGPLDKDEARQLFDRIEEDLRHVECEPHCWNHSDLLSKLFGDEWWHAAGNATEPNPDYDYLCRIVAAVQQALTLFAQGVSDEAPVQVVWSPGEHVSLR